MASDGYTLKEMVSKLLEQNADMERRQIRLEEKVEAVLFQATKTNGRVSELERKLQDIDKWKSYVMGMAAFALALGIPNIIAIASRIWN